MRNIIQHSLKIIRLFEYFLVEIGHSYTLEQRKSLIANSKYLLNLLCLVTSLAFFIDKIVSGDFRVFSELFDSHYLDVFRIINKVGKFDPTMPQSVKCHLSDLEKQIMIVYIWEDGLGFRIITHNNPSQFKLSVQNRLQKHVYDRLFQMHRVMALELETLEKTKGILSYVLNERPNLLENNSIDQIIICSLFATFKLDSHHAFYSL
jgi:hypothetical protein